MHRIRNTQIASLLFAALLLVNASKTTPALAASPQKNESIEAPVPTDSIAANHAPTRIMVRGYVHDANGSPVRAATIRVMSNTDTVQVQSDGTGKFKARLTAAGGVRVLVQAYGYRDLVRVFYGTQAVIQAPLALPPPYPLGWVTVTMAEPAEIAQTPIS